MALDKKLSTYLNGYYSYYSIKDAKADYIIDLTCEYIEIVKDRIYQQPTIALTAIRTELQDIYVHYKRYANELEGYIKELETITSKGPKLGKLEFEKVVELEGKRNTLAEFVCKLEEAMALITRMLLEHYSELKNDKPFLIKYSEYLGPFDWMGKRSEYFLNTYRQQEVHISMPDHLPKGTEELIVRAFVSYAHEDMEYLPKLYTALSPLMEQKLQLWDDRDINAGDTWEEVLFQQLNESDIVLCLVSADFVASDFCYKKEFATALEAHLRGEKTIVPVMLRQTDWRDLPLSKIQGVPGGNEWIAAAKDKDAAWAKVSAALRPALEHAKQRKKKALDAMKMGR